MVESKFIHMCVYCGEVFENNTRNSYECPECEKKTKLLNLLHRADKATSKLKRFRKYMNQEDKDRLEKTIDYVKSRMIKGIDRFSSVPEVIVAIQLKMQGIEYVSQKKIGNKKIDLFLPEMKVCLEIDGELYHTDDEKTKGRDEEIYSILGSEYEIIHIDASNVPIYTWNLKESIPYIVTQRRDNKRMRNAITDDFSLVEFRGLEISMKRGY